MVQRVAYNGWELVKASAAVLREDKELVLFPIVSGLASILVVATFAVPMLLAGMFDRMLAPDGSGQPLGLLVAFVFYVVQYTAIFFANTALVGAALIRLQGGDPSLGDGFRIAAARIVPILGYALISATVGMLLRAISERSGLLGRIVSSLIGFAWSVATYLVVPVLVVENIGPVDAIRRSSELLKRTWGEQLIGNAGISGTFVGISVGWSVLCAVLGVTIVVLFPHTLAPLFGVVGLLIAGLLVIGVIGSTLQGIYTAALYRFAAEGQVSTAFSPEMIRMAFRRR